MTNPLETLPEIAFVETDPEAIQAETVTSYESATGLTLRSGNPERLFLNSLAYLLAVHRPLIDFTGKQNLVAYAIGDNLDHLGALVGCTRLPAAAAKTTLRFTRDEAESLDDIVIPAGTGVSVNDLVFATMDSAVLLRGSDTVDVVAQCDTTGTDGNGYLSGQVANLTDAAQVPYIKSVANITETSGGADTETDAAYRLRIRLAPDAAACGSRAAYVFNTKSVSQTITDVAITTTSGLVVIYPWCDGTAPGAELLYDVYAALTADDVKPLTDTVQVQAPEQVSYDLTLTWYLGADSAALKAKIYTAVTDAIDDYVDWQKQVLGRDLNPQRLINNLLSAGIKRVEISSPVYTVLENQQVAIMGTLDISYGGVEAE